MRSSGTSDDDEAGYDALTRRIRPPLSLRAGLLYLGAVLLLPALCAALLAVWVAYVREQRHVERSMGETARALAMVVDREISMLEAVAWSLGNVKELEEPDLAEFHELARSAAHRIGGWVVVIERAGPAAPVRQLVNTSLPFGTPLSSGSGLSLFDPWTDRTARVSDLFTGPMSRRWVAAVTVPSARRRDGARLAVSVATGPERLQTVIEEQAFPSGWFAGVLDRSGTIVARTPDGHRWIGHPAAAPVRELLASGRNGLVETVTLEGVRVTAYLARSASHGWSFVIGVPTRSFQAAILQSTGWVALVAAVTIALGMFVAWRAGMGALASVSHLADVATALRAGRSLRFRPTGVAELDRVGAALDEANHRIRRAEREQSGASDPTRVLVVGADAAPVDALARLLASQGCTVDPARDPEDARRRLGQVWYDLVIVGAGPAGSREGAAFATWLRERHPDRPVVLAFAHARDPAQARMPGVDVLVEPFTAEAVAAMLARHGLVRGAR